MTDLRTADGTPISPFAFGTMQFGGKADAAAARALYDAARNAGINHFDTALVYTDGASERLIGDFVRPERDAIYLATKIAYDGDASPDNMAQHLDRSRSRLKTDSIDLMYLHRFDDATPLEDTFEVLARWQQQGVIRHIGVSNFAAWQVMKAQAVAETLGTRIDVLQPMYSLVKRQSEVELFPMAMDQRIKLVPYSPLGGGLLTGKYATGSKVPQSLGRLDQDPRYRDRYDVAWMRDCAAALAVLAAKWNLHPATVAVAWAAAHPARPSPIISARSVDQLAPSLAAMQLTLSDSQYREITALSQTPPPATDRLEET